MKVAHISVSNYKCLQNVETLVSSFVCVVGENNAGKSSLLQALLLFIRGTKLSSNEYYDHQVGILITVRLTGIDKTILGQLVEDHRTKIIPYIENETLILARRYSTDGSSTLRIVTDVPRDPKYGMAAITDVLKGKKGAAIAETIYAFYPEIGDQHTISALTTQKNAIALIDAFIKKLPDDQLIESDIPLPTGIDNSVRSLLPEPIYIPAVKDLADELKTRESTSFGKLLNILLDVIEDDLTDAADTFENLRRKLNRLTIDDGTVIDNRMEKVREIEQTIQTNLQETFQNVAIELEIPPPEIKAILSNANIIADDGVRGPVDNKGDGFKRAIAFSILRSYVQLSQDPNWRKNPEDGGPSKDKFLFLFEEPELYLHPRAQNILFDALALISKRHQIVVTTHSPLFFSADNTTTFIKIAKRTDPDLPKPIGVCHDISLTDMSERDKFQLISFETSNNAFFSGKIVLTEGDSELISLPHIAKLLNPAWDFKTTSTNLVKINGKGSFRRYREFFDRFKVPISLICDLDVLLDDFDKLEAPALTKSLRDQLLQAVDKVIEAENRLGNPTRGQLKDEIQKERFKHHLDAVISARQVGNIEQQTTALNALFEFERTNPRLEVLKDHSNSDILLLKRQLIEALREGGIFILEKGAIEDYYPDGITGPDKPSRAQAFSAEIDTEEKIARTCNTIEIAGVEKSEWEIIFSGIFDD